MRIRFTKVVAIFVIFVNVVVVYYGLQLFYALGGLKSYISTSKVKFHTKSPVKSISRWITLVVREFDPNQNDVTETIQSFVKSFPGLQVLILYDEAPYPPLGLTTLLNSSSKNVQAIQLSPGLKVPYTEWYPISRIRTKYVLFVPDSTRLSTKKPLQMMFSELLKHPNDLVAASFSRTRNVKCLSVYINPREWTLKYNSVKGSTCDAVSGKHAILVRTEHLFKLSHAFLLPFPQSLYIQTTFLGLKVKILNNNIVFRDGVQIFKSHHAQWRKRQKDNIKYKNLYQMLQFKQVVLDTGIIEWHGCNRDTARCFPPVLNSMPSYSLEGKWTPPCCLSNLRKTARHVFSILEEAGVRYWLEAGSLLGAMRNSDILPWDYDVDIGFNSNDLSRCTWLAKAKEKPTVDTQGFLWERATEGNFFRIYYSKINKINVNLFPFCPVNGTMIRDAWITSHRNMEFPDNFLHPMSSIEFIGRHVPSPNNIRDFLELKFGKGCIENSNILGY